MDFIEDKKSIIIGAIVGVIVLIFLVSALSKGPRERTQVKEFRRALSVLNQAVAIQNKLTSSTFAGKNKQQIIDAFSARLKAVDKNADSFRLKNGVIYYIGDVNPACNKDGSDKCANITIALNGKRNGKVSTLKHLTGRYAVELRANRVVPAVGSDTANIIRKKR